MIIKRTLKTENGDKKHITIELTHNEMWEAYRKCLHEVDVDGVKWAISNALADACDDEEVEILTKISEDDLLIDELAEECRDRLDNLDEYFSDDVQTYINVVRKSLEDALEERM